MTESGEHEDAFRRDASAFFELLCDESADALFVTDPEGRYLYVNRACSLALGRSADEILGKTDAELTPATSLEKAGFEVRRVRRGAVILGIGRDVREKRHAELALKQSERMLELSQAIAHVGSWSSGLSDDGQLVWSKETRAIFGVPEETPLRVDDFFAQVHPDDLPAVREASRAAIVEGKPYRIDHRIVRKDGSVRWVDERATVTRDETGTPIVMVGTVQDITERKLAEEERRQIEDQLRQSQKLEAVGALAGGVAHDFNNLLSVITSYAELSLLSLPADEKVREHLEEIRTAAGRATALTRQLLAFSRKQIVQPKTIDLNAMVGQLSSLLNRLVGERVEISTLLASDLGAVRADESQMEQVLINLVVNARDAMPSGGRIVIETKNVEADANQSPGQYVMLAVSDEGVGMDETTKARAFEPFFTTKEPGRGTGLGLATAYGVVKQAGGTIRICSERGKGTTLRVTLPRVESVRAERERRPSSESARGGNETILLVEDDAQVRRSVAAILKINGYRLLEARSGEEALDLCRHFDHAIHLLLTDLVMPGIGGPELAERAREIRPELRVLFMSGYTDGELLRAGVADGLAFLVKPFTPEQVTLKIRELLDQNIRQASA